MEIGVIGTGRLRQISLLLLYVCTCVRIYVFIYIAVYVCTRETYLNSEKQTRYNGPCNRRIVTISFQTLFSIRFGR